MIRLVPKRTKQRALKRVPKMEGFVLLYFRVSKQFHCSVLSLVFHERHLTRLHHATWSYDGPGMLGPRPRGNFRERRSKVVARLSLLCWTPLSRQRRQRRASMRKGLAAKSRLEILISTWLFTTLFLARHLGAKSRQQHSLGCLFLDLLIIRA